ncbi:hypothetical protein BSKO_11169 [Bryopsis sp. KO-2023]|nr:hypothetical protein BSKO_11169 [Bryopsis sp. KO-2023]
MEGRGCGIVSEICHSLEEKRKDLTALIGRLESGEQRCAQMLRFLEEEKSRWVQKLEDVKENSERVQRQQDEVQLMIEFHRSLGSPQDIRNAVRRAQCVVEQELPRDVHVMIGDCLNSRQQLHVKSCLCCMRKFSAKDLLKASTSSRCRFSMRPCGHAAVCGECAEKIWATSKKCPTCRAELTKKPVIFKPGRWQHS